MANHTATISTFLFLGHTLNIEFCAQLKMHWEYPPIDFICYVDFADVSSIYWLFIIMPRNRFFFKKIKMLAFSWNTVNEGNGKQFNFIFWNVFLHLSLKNAVSAFCNCYKRFLWSSFFFKKTTTLPTRLILVAGLKRREWRVIASSRFKLVVENTRNRYREETPTVGLQLKDYSLDK